MMGNRVESDKSWQSVLLTLGEQGPTLSGTFGEDDNGELAATGDLSIVNGQVVASKSFDTPIEVAVRQIEGIDVLELELTTKGFVQDRSVIFRLVPEPSGLALMLFPMAAGLIRRRRMA